MVFVLQSTKLLKEPDGEPVGEPNDALLGDEADVVEKRDGWVHVRIHNAEGKGWLPFAFLGDADPIEPDEVDEPALNRMCWIQGLHYQITPHYLVAVAKLRSTINLPDKIGAFRFTKDEWKAALSDPLVDLADNEVIEDQIKIDSMQCIVFAAMAARDLKDLKTRLGHQPSARELYLAQLIGPAAAEQAIRNPGNTILSALNVIQLPGGLTREQMLAKHARYLSDPPTPVTCEAALKRIADDLKTALDAVKAGVIRAGGEVFGIDPNEDALIGDPGDPSQTQLPGTPTGNPEGVIDKAGGILGELIASGEGDYGSFNRGKAGDSAGKSMDFSRMTIGDIMVLQALPKGQPQRLFAVGKYQIIPGTMKETVEQLGISRLRTFTPFMQEFMFRNHLVGGKRPQVKRFIMGKSDDVSAAQLALAQEFASVADPRTGRSFFDGQAGNSSSITAAQSKAALNGEREKFQTLLATLHDENKAWQALSPGLAEGAGGGGTGAGTGGGAGTGAGGGTGGAAFGALSAADVLQRLKQQIAAGRITFQDRKFRADLLGESPGTRVTLKLQFLVLRLSEMAAPIQISSVVRTAGHHGTGRAIDIGNEVIANKLLPQVAIQEQVEKLQIDEIIFDAAVFGEVGDKRQKWNFDLGRPHKYGEGTLRQHNNHIHFAVKA